MQNHYIMIKLKPIIGLLQNKRPILCDLSSPEGTLENWIIPSFNQ